MSQVKSMVKAIYDNKPKVVRESINNAINEKATQILEARKVKIAKNIFVKK